MLPSLLRRAILFAEVQLYPVNNHQTRNFPSDCITTILICSLNPDQMMKESSLLQLGFKRIILFVTVQLYITNHPPRIILPSSWKTIDLILLLNHSHTLKEVSIDPLVFKRAILYIVVQL